MLISYGLNSYERYDDLFILSIKEKVDDDEKVSIVNVQVSMQIRFLMHAFIILRHIFLFRIFFAWRITSVKRKVKLR